MLIQRHLKRVELRTRVACCMGSFWSIGAWALLTGTLSVSFFDSAVRFWLVSVAIREFSARTSACRFRSHVSATRAKSVRRPAKCWCVCEGGV